MRTENSKLRRFPPRMIVRSSSDRLVWMSNRWRSIILSSPRSMTTSSQVHLDEAKEVVHLDREQAAWLERAVRLREHLPVLLVAEVAERREPTEDAVESIRPRNRPHVALDVLDLDARARPRPPAPCSRNSGVASSPVTRTPRSASAFAIRPCPHARSSSSSPGSSSSSFQTSSTSAAVRSGRQQLLVEVQVVLVERVLTREVGAHAASLAAHETARQVPKARFSNRGNDGPVSRRRSSACSVSSGRTAFP